MKFKGQLLIPSEQGPGLAVDLEVADHHLALASESEELGAWPLEAIKARRLRGDTFAITVAGEDLHFVAGDPISFAYTGMPAIQRFSRSRARSPLRSLLQLFAPDPSKRHPQPEATSPTSPPATEAPVAQEAASSPTETQTPTPHIPAEDELSDPFELELSTQDPSIVTTPSSEGDVISRPRQEQAMESEASVPPIETKRCHALRHDGLPCQSPVVGPSGYCSSHDPDRALGQGFRKAQEARARLRTKGTARLTRVYTRLDKAFRQVERGDLDPDQAMAMAQLARTMCAILDLDEESPSSAHRSSS